MEAADQRAVRAGAEGVLELVAVAPALDRGDDRLELVALEVADPPQRLVDLLLLDLELALVAELLPGSAGMGGLRRHPVGPRLEHLDGARVGVAALALAHAGADEVARERAVDEHDVAAVGARDARAAEGQRADAQLELVADRRPRCRRVHASSSHSSSAFCAWRRFSA